MGRGEFMLQSKCPRGWRFELATIGANSSAALSKARIGRGSAGSHPYLTLDPAESKVTRAPPSENLFLSILFYFNERKTRRGRGRWAPAARSAVGSAPVRGAFCVQ